MRRVVVVALASTALLASSAGAQALPESRVRVSLVALEGPLRGVEMTHSDGSGARIELSLVEGESRTLRLPLPVPVGAQDVEPRIEVDGLGSARILPSTVATGDSLMQAAARLPMSLRQRPLPPPPAARDPSSPPPAAWLLACAGFSLALRLRARGAHALLAGLAGGGAALAVSAAEQEVHNELVVLEGSADSPMWLRVRTGNGRFALPDPTEAVWIETRPPRAPLDLRVREGAHGLEVALQSRSAIYQLEPFELGQALTRSGPNSITPFERVWVREPDGAWSQRGPWHRGKPLPPADPGESQPPSWIQPALPLGTGILIAKEARETVGVGGMVTERWVRLVGF
jgi:hypothetical protein